MVVATIRAERERAVGGKKRKRVKDDRSQGEAKDDKGRGGGSGGEGGFHPKYCEGLVKGGKAGKDKGGDAGDDGASSGIVKVRKRPKIKSSTVGAGEGREEEARFDGGSDEEGRTREGGGG